MSIDPRILSQLAHFDGKVHRHRSAIAAGKKREAVLAQQRVEVAAESEERKGKLQELQSANKVLEKEIDEFNQKAKQYSGRLNEIQDQREWRALNDEVRYLKRQVENREEQILANMELVEKADAEWKAAFGDFEEREQDIKNERNKIVAEREMHVREMTAASDALEQYLTQIPEATVRFYRRRAGRQEMPVVWMSKDACSHCHSKLPPQMQLEISTGKNLVTCESCGRIIVAPLIKDSPVS